MPKPLFESRSIGTEVREYTCTRVGGVLDLVDYGLLAIIALIVFMEAISTPAKIWTWKLAVPSIVFVVHALLRCQKVAVKETLTVVRELGIQKKTVNVFGASIFEFVDAGHIEDVLITETVGVFSLSYCLVVRVNTMENLFVCFEQNIPELRNLVAAYQGTRHVLFREPEVQVAVDPIRVDGHGHSIQDGTLKLAGRGVLPSSISIPANMSNLAGFDYD